MEGLIAGAVVGAAVAASGYAKNSDVEDFDVIAFGITVTLCAVCGGLVGFAGVTDRITLGTLGATLGIAAQNVYKGVKKRVK